MSEIESAEKYLKIATWAVLTFSIFCVLFVLTNYEIAWMHPENLVKRDMVLPKVYPTLGSAFLEVFNWPVWEAGSPRLTRLLSSFFDVIDTHFRSWFNTNIFPHPSISVSWIFVLFLAPFYLYKTLICAGHKKSIAILGICVFLSTPAVQSLVAMNFRSGKAIALYFLIYILYLVLRQRTNEIAQQHKTPFITKDAAYILLIFAISLFSDEIAVFSLGTILIFQRYTRLQSVVLPILALATSGLYLLFVRNVLPLLHESAGFPVLCEGHCEDGQYDLQARFFKTIFLDYDIAFYANLLWVISLNSWIAFRDLTGLGLLWAEPFGSRIILGYATLITLFSLGASFLRTYIARSDARGDWAVGTSDISLSRYSLFFLLALLLHGILMSLTKHPIWGVYWYGIFICVPFSLLFVFILSCVEKLDQSTRLLPPIFAGIIVAANFTNFISTNYAYKDYHYYPMRARQLPDMFSMKDNKFSLTDNKGKQHELFSITRQFLELRHGLEQMILPLELEYLIHEAHICPWEFDYYHHIAKTAESLTVTCFSTHMPTLRSELLLKSDLMEKIYGKESVKYLGLYDDGGYADKRAKAYFDLGKDNKPYIMNSSGGHSLVELDGNKIYSLSWKLTGEFDPKKRAINWENGSVWVKNNNLPDFK